MSLKSTQTNKYETCCFVQEAATDSELDPRGFKTMVSVDGYHYCEFPATIQTFGGTNRNQRRYDPANVMSCINNDERIQRLIQQNKWRGELNHPNPDVQGQRFTDMRMSIPEQKLSSHMIRSPKLDGGRLRAVITTHPGTDNGRTASSEIIDLGAVPSFSARLFGTMIPNASINVPNMRVTKVITYDMVDFPSHQEADGDIKAKIHTEYAGDIMFLKELAKYCQEKSEQMRVVCESFEISPEELMGISSRGDLIVEQADHSRLHLKMEKDIRNEALDILMKRGI